MCEIIYGKNYVRFAYSGVLYVWEIQTLDIPHIQRRVDIAHMHASGEQNVKYFNIDYG